MTAAAPPMNAVAWGLLVVLSLLWGGSFFFAEIALRELPPFTVVLGRVGIAAIALHLLLLVNGQRMPTSLGLWGAFLVMGALNNLIPFSLIVWGQTQITSGLASILNATTPLFAVVVAHLLTKDEKLTASRFAGVIVGLAGTVLMIGPAALAGIGAEFLAQLAILTAALTYSFASLYGRRFKGLQPTVIACGQVTCSTLLLIPLVLLVDRPFALDPPGAATIASLLGIGVFSTALAYILYFKILALAGATNLMLVTFLIPISALLLGTLFLGEVITTAQIAGMILIAAGLALIDARLLPAVGLTGPRRIREASDPSSTAETSVTEEG
ncbi:MAG: DMT family transporter [Geminicoccaceae bacterium]